MTALGRHHLPGASFEAQLVDAGCMRGTRVHFLAQLRELVTAHTGPHIVWVVGMAGTGKTAIALTLCRMLAVDTTVILGGSFFCSRFTEVQRIVPTLATTLARQWSDYASKLIKQLSSYPDVADWTICKQIEHLLARPLEELDAHDCQIVFVVDALDECNAHAKLVELFEALAGFQSTVPVKFLLTSRPEMVIRKTQISDSNISSVLH